MSEEVEYLSADAEDKFVIAQANTPLYLKQRICAPSRFLAVITAILCFPVAASVNYMDVAPHQVVGISAALIPFLEHDDANRALMGSNMQAQAVPLINPDSPLISTGMERFAALDSGQVVIAQEDGDVISVTGRAGSWSKNAEGKNHDLSPAQVSALQSEHLY